MNVLAIDGALGAFSAAVARDGRLVAQQSSAGQSALERGLGTIAAVLAESGLRSQAPDRVAVGIGPGGFTGLRIAVSYAKALAQAWRRPLVPISSFDLLEYDRDFGAQPVLTIVVGRPGVVSARLRQGGRVRRASGPTAQALSDLGWGENELNVIGAPKDVLAALAERGILVNSLDPIVTPAAAAAALEACRREPARSLHEVRADYGEAPAAKVPKPPST